MDCNMDQDKENVQRKGRLPVPQAPLPALPHNFLKKLRNRPALVTLAGTNGHNPKGPAVFDSKTQGFAGPGNSKRQRLIARPKSPLRMIFVSSDDKNDSNEETGKDGARKSLILPCTSTPAVNALQPKRRRNFDQKIRERLQSPDILLKSYKAYSSDFLENLLEVETRSMSLPRVECDARARVINWLMKMNGLGGHPATIQTAVWYLDAVLATGDVILEYMQLIAAASYWIAAKIHDPLTPASRLVEFANNVFTAQSLSEAEAVIMDRLNCPRQPVIPQEYLSHFAWWCSKERLGEIEVAATYLCLCGMMVDKSLCTEYPSVVAAASIMNALQLLRKSELIPKLRKCSAYVAAEKKAGTLSRTCTIFRHAVCKVASMDYSHKFLFEQYGVPPMYIAQTVASEAFELDSQSTTATTSSKVSSCRYFQQKE